VQKQKPNAAHLATGHQAQSSKAEKQEMIEPQNKK
jgi:hypothetical protein